MIEPNDVVLFQGDSITDAGRDRAATVANAGGAGLGHGYVLMAASRLLAERPAERLQIHNRGIGGSQVIHLAERWQRDCLDLEPTLLSILIGVNDTWRGFDGGVPVPVDRYRQVYHQLLADAREAMPSLKLVLCEPFVVKCGVVTDAWLPEITERQQVVRDLAAEFGARVVAFQAAFDAACEQASPCYWAFDGVHPTPAGFALMARTWLEAVTD